MSAWLVETVVATTLLMGLVLLVRGHVARLFGARTAYLLWLLPALRMVLPPLPEAVGPAPIEQLPVIVDFSMIEAVESAPVTVESGIAWGMVLLAIWLTGALCHFCWHLIAYRRFVSNALAEAVQLPELDRDGIEVSASRAIDGPFATGVLVQKIVLPHDYRHRYTATELRLALMHEWAHHRRGDLSFNYLALTMLSLHWFNPIAHRAWRAFRADQELACDAIVLEGATPDERHAYGTALVKSACARTPVAACALNPRDQLKLRLRMMRGGTKRTLMGHGLAALLVGAGLALTASGGIAAETTREVEDTLRGAVVENSAMLQAVAVSTIPEVTAAPQTPESADGPLAPPVAPSATAALPAPAALPVAEASWREAAAEGRRAAEEGRRAAEEGRRAAEAGRREGLRQAEIARREALVEAQHARREGQRAAEEGRREGLRQAENARREAERARREGQSAAEEGRRQAEIARREGQRHAEEARRRAQEVRRDYAAFDIKAVKCDGNGEPRQIVENRTRTVNGRTQHVMMVRFCTPKSDHAEAKATRIAALSEARADIADEEELSDVQRAHALRAIDLQLQRLRQAD